MAWGVGESDPKTLRCREKPKELHTEGTISFIISLDSNPKERAYLVWESIQGWEVL